jgi:spoIIIJ-associated protein
VRDPVFEGRDVSDALGLAERATGRKAEQLRYVVLDAGTLPAPGQPGRPARIAVLAAADATAPAPAGAEPALDPGTQLRALVQCVGAAAGLSLEARLEAGAAATVVHVTGGDELLLRNEAAPLRALEHLLQRALGDRFESRLVLDVAGYRGAREARLERQVRAWAEEVRRTGRPRETPPMNAYDRRLVHLTLAGEPDLRTFSVGEGSARRVTIAPAAETP